jgi:protein-L-isoaspartate(D-aspartate) O-methyltransferase
MAGSRLAGQGEYERPRQRLAERLVRAGIKDPRVLEALSSVPRHRLLPEALREQAYQDAALPIGEGQTMSAPRVVAAMTEALELQGHETVLEVGTGSGYQAAILSRLAGRVISIEHKPRLAALARSALDHLGISNVVVHLGDGSAGRRQDAPFDAIVVTAGGPDVPRPLIDQLAMGGRLVGPFGKRSRQDLVRVRRDRQGTLERQVIGRCRFVDLVGVHGWAV